LVICFISWDDAIVTVIVVELVRATLEEVISPPLAVVILPADVN
jgi:hypothetical protein